jgi:hypothetical protein
MTKFLFFAVLLLALFMLFKVSKRRNQLPTAAPGALKKPLSPAQQLLFARLQGALPSTLIMVQPSLGQLVELPENKLAQTLFDFAVCRKDSSPLGVVLLDASAHSPALEQAVTQAGLKYAHFRADHLPTEQELRDALGFL